MILALARDLAPRCDLTVAFLKGPGRLAPAFAALGVRVLQLRLERGRALKGTRRLRKLLVEGRFDLVHTHLFHAGLLGRAFARLNGVQAVVHTQHNTLTWETQSRYLSLANRVSLRMAHRVIAVGEGGDDAELAERKWLPADDSADASYIAIYPPKVAMITLADKNYPVVVIIDSAAIASTQQILFDTLWKLL